MIANALACISMFLIGAPLGAIIKRGGLGFPVINSVVFFIIYYVISIGGEKYAKAGSVSVISGVLGCKCYSVSHRFAISASG
jgi:lipopolysaccharide export system permease protein